MAYFFIPSARRQVALAFGQAARAGPGMGVAVIPSAAAPTAVLLRPARRGSLAARGPGELQRLAVCALTAAHGALRGQILS